MLGHPSISLWGSPQWGDQAFEPARFAKLDCVARGTLEVGCSVDSVAAAHGLEKAASLDNVAQATGELSCNLDVYQGRVPTDAFLAELTENVVLVELRLPAGTIRLATIDLQWGGSQWTGRLVSTGTIMRTEGSGTDDMQLQLDDTNEAGQERFRDIFLADDPEGSGVTVWVVLLDDLARNRYQLFEGRIERVASFSRSTVRIDVLRNEAVDDVELGRPVTLGTWPDAPDDSLSETIPVVFGEVENSEGIPVKTNAISQLEHALEGRQGEPVTFQPIQVIEINNKLPVLEVPGTGVVLRDASEFPAAGTVKVDGEEIEYLSIVGDELLAIRRGANGTEVAEHAKGAEVQEVGEFQVLLADHGLSKIDSIRILGPEDNLGEPVPEPSSIDYAAATITWPETPRIRDPNSESEFQRVHFRDIDPTNRAPGAEFVARESPSYRAFGVARLGPGRLVLRTNTDGLGIPGELLRVWLGVIFDPETLGPPGAAGLGEAGATDERPFSSAIVGIPGAARAIVAGESFSLQPSDTVPPDIARRDERTGDRLYDVPDPVFEPDPGSSGTQDLSPNLVVDPGIWLSRSLAERVIDGDPETEAVFVFVGLGEVAMVGTADAIFRLTDPPDLGNRESVAASLVFVAGWGPPYVSLTSPFLTQLVDRSSGEVIVELMAETLSPAGFGVGYIRDVETFSASFDPAKLGEDLSRLPDLDFVVKPRLGVSAGIWVGRELFIAIETEDKPPESKATIDPLGSVTNYFEVTHLVGLNPSQKDPGQGWAFFSDLSRGGRVTFETALPGLVDPQLLEAFWVAEHVPFLNASTKTPRVFADVRGLTGRQASVTPADISELILTGTPPLGMGLSVDSIGRESYNATKASLQTDGLVQGFAIRKPVSAVRLLEQIAAQGDCRQTWVRGRHQIIRRPRADTSLPVFRTLTGTNDILLNPGLKMGRSSIDEARTRLTILYRVYAPSGKTSRSIEVINAAAEAKFGRIAKTLELGLIRDDASAQLVADRMLERLHRPRWHLEFDMALPGLELAFGDLVTVQHVDIPGDSFEVGEIVGLSLHTQGLDCVCVTVAVWKE